MISIVINIWVPQKTGNLLTSSVIILVSREGLHSMSSFPPGQVWIKLSADNSDVHNVAICQCLISHAQFRGSIVLVSKMMVLMVTMMMIVVGY